MKKLSFTQRIAIEQGSRYIVIFAIVAFLWSPIREMLIVASEESDKLDAIAVIMGIISLCALTGYFAFSYATVGKKALPRFFGYLCATFLTIPLLLTWLILYFISSIWVPEMEIVWGSILFTLYIGTFLFDNLDLLRMGRDVAAVNFFENASYGQNSDSVSSTISFLREGQRLELANALIGRAMIDLGKDKNDEELQEAGRWIIKNSDNTQHEIDKKVAETTAKYAQDDDKLSSMISDLESGQSHSIADSLIASILEIIKNK